MRRESLDVKILSYGLAAVYGFGLLVYLGAYIISFFDPQAVLSSPLFELKFAGVTEFQKHTVILWALFFPQFIAFVAVARLQEWARKLVIIMNAAMFLYVTYQMAAVLQRFHPLYFATQLVYICIILFFTLPRIKVKFRTDIKMRNQTILIVDDDRALIQLVRKYLLAAGFDVLAASTGEKGLQLAKKRKPDLIILDVILPGMKGRQVCTKLKENNSTRNIPVIFLTAKDSPDDVRAEMEAGGTVHLTKPVENPKLIAEIENILGGLKA